MDDFKETLTTAVCLLSMIIIFGMLILDIAGFGILQDPALQTVWYISIGLFFLSYLAIPIQAREGEVSRRWRPPLELEPSPTPHGVVKRFTTSHSELEPSQSSEPRGPGIDDNMATEVPSEPQVPRGTKASTLEQKPLEREQSLEREEEALEQSMLEPLEQSEDVRTLGPPTKEELKVLKNALGLTHGSLQYKRRGDGVYHVVWNREAKKHEWTHLGSWLELKAKLAE